MNWILVAALVLHFLMSAGKRAVPGVPTAIPSSGVPAPRRSRAEWALAIVDGVVLPLAHILVALAIRCCEHC